MGYLQEQLHRLGRKKGYLTLEDFKTIYGSCKLSSSGNRDASAKALNEFEKWIGLGWLKKNGIKYHYMLK